MDLFICSTSDVRRTGDIDILGHLKKENYLRDKLEEERIIAENKFNKLHSEKENLKQKTVAVVEGFKIKLAYLENELEKALESNTQTSSNLEQKIVFFRKSIRSSLINCAEIVKNRHFGFSADNLNLVNNFKMIESNTDDFINQLKQFTKHDCDVFRSDDLLNKLLDEIETGYGVDVSFLDILTNDDSLPSQLRNQLDNLHLDSHQISAVESIVKSHLNCSTTVVSPSVLGESKSFRGGKSSVRGKNKGNRTPHTGEKNGINLKALEIPLCDQENSPVFSFFDENSRLDDRQDPLEKTAYRREVLNSHISEGFFTTEINHCHVETFYKASSVEKDNILISSLNPSDNLQTQLTEATAHISRLTAEMQTLRDVCDRSVEDSRSAQALLVEDVERLSTLLSVSQQPMSAVCSVVSPDVEEVESPSVLIHRLQDELREITEALAAREIEQLEATQHSAQTRLAFEERYKELEAYYADETARMHAFLEDKAQTLTEANAQIRELDGELREARAFILSLQEAVKENRSSDGVSLVKDDSPAQTAPTASSSSEGIAITTSVAEKDSLVMRGRVDELTELNAQLRAKARAHSTRLREKLRVAESELVARTEELKSTVDTSTTLQEVVNSLQTERLEQHLEAERKGLEQIARHADQLQIVEAAVFEKEGLLAAARASVAEKELILMASREELRVVSDSLELAQSGRDEAAISIIALKMETTRLLEECELLRSSVEVLTKQTQTDADQIIQLQQVAQESNAASASLRQQMETVAMKFASQLEVNASLEMQLEASHAALSSERKSSESGLLLLQSKVADLSAERSHTEQLLLTAQDELQMMALQFEEFRAQSLQQLGERRLSGECREDQALRLSDLLGHVERQLSERDAELQEAYALVTELEGSVSTTQEESERQQSEFATVVASLVTEHAQLQSQLASCNRDCADKVLEVDGINTTIERISSLLSTKFASISGELQLRVEACSIAREQVSELEIAFAAFRVTASQAQEASVVREHELLDTIETLRRKCDLLIQENCTAQSAVVVAATTESKLVETRTLLDDSTRIVEDLRAENLRLEELVHTDRQANQQQVQALKESLNVLREQSKVRAAKSIEKVRSLTAQLETRSTESKNATERVVELETKIASLGSSEQIVTAEASSVSNQLVARVAALEAELEEKNAALTMQVESVTQFAAQITDLTNKLTTLKQQSKTRATQSIEKIKSLQAQLLQSSREAGDQVVLEASLQSAHDLRRSDEQRFVGEIGALMAQRDELQIALNAAKTRADRKAEEVRRLRITVNSQQSQRDRMRLSMERIVLMKNSLEDGTSSDGGAAATATKETKSPEDLGSGVSDIQQALQQKLKEIRDEAASMQLSVTEEANMDSDSKRLFERISSLHAEVERRVQECDEARSQLAALSVLYENLKREHEEQRVLASDMSPIASPCNSPAQSPASPSVLSAATECHVLRERVSGLETEITSLLGEHQSLAATERSRQSLIESVASTNKRLAVQVGDLESRLVQSAQQYTAALVRVEQLEAAEGEHCEERLVAQAHIRRLAQTVADLEEKLADGGVSSWEAEAEAQRLHELRVSFAGFITAGSMDALKTHGRHMCTVLQMSSGQEREILASMLRLAPIIIAYSSIEHMSSEFGAAVETMVFGGSTEVVAVPSEREVSFSNF